MKRTYIQLYTNTGAEVISASLKTCPHCGCINKFNLRLSKTIHHGALHCPECGKFVKWASKQKNFEQQQREDSLINELLKHPNLFNDWEIEFLRNVCQKKKRSPKQREKLRQIAEKFQLSRQGGVA